MSPARPVHGVLSLAFVLLAASWIAGASATPPARAQEPRTTLVLPGDGSSGCVACHAGIEDMHPAAELSCVDCHGGDARATSKEQAHVARTRADADDERVAPRDEDLVQRRFVNPMDLRVAHLSCGRCHPDETNHVLHSLHGTTAGHLSDGYYEVGLHSRKESTWSVFPVEAPKGPNAPASPLPALAQVPPFDPSAKRDSIATHYADLARKECMQCHLWSSGRATEGRVGFDGDHRGEGCAACHVEYALDGLTDSADAVAQRREPGHPRRHALTRAPATDTCVSCHYGDATIGLNFRGLSQLPPGAPGGPEIPGTTDHLRNRQFYLQDAAVNPPDVHHERGMHCIDCHTAGDVMGDGRLVGAMEQAVEISCSDCHGTFSELATLTTQRGTPLKHLRREGERVILKSKVDGKEHPLVQVKHVLDPARPEFNARAAQAMTGAHARVECYTCHSSWNANFLGFHFDRNESLTQLDLLSGKRTPGRVTTQEKVFATWKSFYAGFNERGAVAPYLTGFSTMGSVTDASGERILDQVMPETAAGLSGVTMIHHQMHSVRKSSRSCVECHRTSGTWGLGTPNFQITRQLAFAADRRGIEVVALDRAKPVKSLPLAKLVLPDVTSLALLEDPLQGRAQFLYAGEGSRAIHAIDVSEPTQPKRTHVVECVDPQQLLVRGKTLFVADGAGGLATFDLANPAQPKPLARIPMCNARAIAIQWPWAYVADGPSGLVIVDVRDPRKLELVGGLVPHDDRGDVHDLVDVSVLFQYSRPIAEPLVDPTETPPPTDGAAIRAARRRERAGIADDPKRATDRRTSARMLCALVDATRGPFLLDVTEPRAPLQIWPDPKRTARPGRETETARNEEYRAIVLRSHVDLAQPGGGPRTSERDYAYVLSETNENGLQVSFLRTIDVSDALRPRSAGRARVTGSTETLTPLALYNAPFLQTFLFAAGYEGLELIDVNTSSQPAQVGPVESLRQCYAVAVESFGFDRMLDESDRPLKDVSHAPSRWLKLDEVGRILDVDAAALGTLPAGRSSSGTQVSMPPSWTARLDFARRDADDSAFLEAQELDGLDLARTDRDGDGRVGLAEFTVRAGVMPEMFAVPSFVTESQSRTGPDGDLARLFDGVDPHAFDGDGDGRLSRADIGRALFAALDLDRDGHLSRAEASRAPGELRRVRFGGAAATGLLRRYDADGNGTLEPRELELRDDDWRALDADRDGAVQLASTREGADKRRGYDVRDVEWPARVVARTRLPPDVTLERLYAVFDQDGDRALSKRELAARPDLLLDMDDDRDGKVSKAEIDPRLVWLAQGGADAAREDFRERWDLDGDGRVSREELALPRWVFERLAPKSAK